MQTFAVIPAAGRSLRMGQPKLLLPWGESTVLEHVLATWSASRVGRVILVVHPQDTEIVKRGAAAGAHVVQPETAPEEMKVSVQLALDYISHFAPSPTDAWLLAPADMPTLATATIDQLIAAYEKLLEVAFPNGLMDLGTKILIRWLMG